MVFKCHVHQHHYITNKNKALSRCLVEYQNHFPDGYNSFFLHNVSLILKNLGFCGFREKSAMHCCLIVFADRYNKLTPASILKKILELQQKQIWPNSREMSELSPFNSSLEINT